MGRIAKVEVKGVIEYDDHIPKKEIHDWVNICPFPWRDVKVIIESRSKFPARKGSSFERQFCKQLSLWVSGGVDSDIYWRTTGSGGWSTKKGSPLQLGDVTCFPEKQKDYGWLLDYASIELKNMSLSLGSLFKIPFQFIEILINKLHKAGVVRIPFVIMKSEGVMITLSPSVVARRLNIAHMVFNEVFAIFNFEDLLQICPTEVFNVFKLLMENT